MHDRVDPSANPIARIFVAGAECRDGLLALRLAWRGWVVPIEPNSCGQSVNEEIRYNQDEFTYAA
ncbi:hypothetical protein [Bradyrhizobium sp. HKCCYLR20261]|uniref:hypothetical protein n=1 Tax=Bradyrhizobium sp. HKCCYLR20261 TaxID=3420760 RepID=UPI003EB966E8